MRATWILALASLASMSGCSAPEKPVECSDATELDDVVELCDLRFELRPDEDVMVVVGSGRRPFAWENVNLSAHQSVDAERRLCASMDAVANDSGSNCVAMSPWVDATRRLSVDHVRSGRVALGQRLGFCVAGDANLPLRLGISLDYREASGAAQNVYRGFTHGDLGPIRKC